MTNLKGIHSNILNVSIEKLIGVLLFAEFPSTFVFVDKEGEPIIKEWVDCSDNGDIDRYFYYKTTKLLLKKFINSRISHQDLIINSTDGLLYFQDVHNLQPIDNIIISSQHLPEEYKPSSSFYLKENEGVDINSITKFFDLESISLTTPVSSTIKELSISKKTESLNIHIAEGEGNSVGFGTINTDILGLALIKFDNLYKDIGLDISLGKSRGKIKLHQNQHEELFLRFSTEVYANMAASYSIFLKPKVSVPTYNMFNAKSEPEIIAQRLFDFISNSYDLDTLEREYIHHSDHTIESYKGFLTNIYEMKLDLNLNWFSPFTSNKHEKRLNYRTANRILSNIEGLNIETQEDFVKTGKFREVHCDTGHFVFISNTKEDFNGFFHKQKRKDLERITFTSLYEINISRKTVKRPGKTKAEINDKILDYKEDV